MNDKKDFEGSTDDSIEVADDLSCNLIAEH